VLGTQWFADAGDEAIRLFVGDRVYRTRITSSEINGQMSVDLNGDGIDELILDADGGHGTGVFLELRYILLFQERNGRIRPQDAVWLESGDTEYYYQSPSDPDPTEKSGYVDYIESDWLFRDMDGDGYRETACSIERTYRETGRYSESEQRYERTALKQRLTGQYQWLPRSAVLLETDGRDCDPSIPAAGKQLHLTGEERDQQVQQAPAGPAPLKYEGPW